MPAVHDDHWTPALILSELISFFLAGGGTGFYPRAGDAGPIMGQRLVMAVVAALAESDLRAASSSSIQMPARPEAPAVGGAIQLAGQVKAKRDRRSTRSDWMPIERMLKRLLYLRIHGY